VRDNGRVSDPQTPAASSAPIDTQQATVRRAPKLGVFLLVGAGLGALVTLILTSLFPADPNVGFWASYAYFLIYGIPFGVVVAALVGLALDRRSRRRARTITVEHQRVD
jgi:hypothetical protein